MRRVLLLLALLFAFQKSWSQARGSFEKDVERYAHMIGLPAYALGVAEGNKLVFFKSAGFADSAGKEAITKDHIFEIASISKSLTSIALQQLEQAGKLSLNDPIDKFPNRYFTKERWNAQTTLAHFVSHTSESTPLGSAFVYNGSRYNIVFNAFTAVNPMDSTEEMTRPFTIQIEKGILNPLQMTHTLTRFTEQEHGSLRKWVAVKYSLDAATGKYVPRPVNPVGMQSGPGFGNPLLSPVVASFVRNYLLNAPGTIDFEGDLARIEASLEKQGASNVRNVLVILQAGRDDESRQIPDDPQSRAKAILERLVRYKDYVTAKDRLYNEAKEMLSKL